MEVLEGALSLLTGDLIGALSLLKGDLTGAISPLKEDFHKQANLFYNVFPCCFEKTKEHHLQLVVL